MKEFKKKKKFKIIALGLFLLGIFNFTAPIMASTPPEDSLLNGEFVKNFDATYTLNDNGAVFLINKHGKIKIAPTTDNKVIIKVRVTANTNSQSNADKIFSRVNIQFSNSDTYVKAETVITGVKGGWFFNVGGDEDFTIDYDVSMPKNCNLDVTNKYGDTYIGALNNYVKIEQHYGNFKLEAAKYANIGLAYGEGFLNEVGGMTGNISYSHLSASYLKDVQLKSKYSEFHIKKAQNAMIESAYDDYFLDDAKNIVINSRYGDFNIGSINDIRVNSSYTDFKIKSIANEGNFIATYGEVVISKIESGFNAIDITGNYTNFKLGMDENISFQGDIASNYADLNIPKSFVKKLHDIRGSHEEIVGYMANDKAKSSIKAKLNYGGLQLK